MSPALDLGNAQAGCMYPHRTWSIFHHTQSAFSERPSLSNMVGHSGQPSIFYVQGNALGARIKSLALNASRAVLAATMRTENKSISNSSSFINTWLSLVKSQRPPHLQPPTRRQTPPNQTKWLRKCAFSTSGFSYPSRAADRPSRCDYSLKVNMCRVPSLNSPKALL